MIRRRRCARIGCNTYPVRNGVCLTHWRELWGDSYAPWPADLTPADWRERYLAKHGTPHRG